MAVWQNARPLRAEPPERLRERSQRRAEHALSALMHLSTRIRFRPWKNWQIRWFIKRYGVNMAETIAQHPDDYPDFNTFFTRSLRPEVRTWSAPPSVLSSPADGVLSAHGAIRDGHTVTAKGARFSVQQLLAESGSFADRLADAWQFTIYLSPRDYHRVHMPIEGRLVAINYVPGRLFSVNPATVERVPDLFARNERVVSLFETTLGAVAVVMVGAVFVGEIEHSCCGLVTPPRGRQPATMRFDQEGTGAALTNPAAPILPGGSELGRFHMGSTVVVLVERSDLEIPPAWDASASIHVGNELARLR